MSARKEILMERIAELTQLADAAAKSGNDATEFISERQNLQEELKSLIIEKQILKG